MTAPVPWWRDAVIYVIYPRSFRDANGDGVGDLRGIIEKLDYLRDGTPGSLNVDAIWICPFFPSPMRDFGYDITDYEGVDPLFGTRADLDELIAAAHARGLRVLLDLVLNHTSDEHPWFVESRRDRENPKADWFIWHDGVKGKPPNNWFAGFELKSAWWWDEARRQFYLGTFTRHQPEVNWRNPELRAAMLGVARRWLERGIDGFRLDVVNWYVKDAEWRSNPWRLSLHPPDLQRHIYDRNRPETHEICRELRALADGFGDRVLVGEIYDNDAARAASYLGQGDELHYAFNFAFLYQRWSARGFAREIERWERLVPPGAWPNYTLSNHDQPRHASRYAAGRWTEPRARVAAAMLLTLRGTPFLYYGEEIGMPNGRVSRAALQDPLGKRAWPFHPGRDVQRTPMQWSGGPNAGFGAGKPWLPVGESAARCNVEQQRGDPRSLWAWYRDLLALRRASPGLRAGSYEPVVPGEGDVLGYVRRAPEQAVGVLLNFAHRPRTVAAAGFGARRRVLLGSHRAAGDELAESVTLAPCEAVIFEVDR